MADRSYLTWPFFEDRHRDLANRLEDWSRAQDWAIDHHDVDGACHTLVTRLGEAGWLRPAVAGAEPFQVRSLCLLREGLAYRCGLADFAFAMQGLGSGAISLFGSAAQRAAYLPAVAAGTKIAAFALSEKDAGSDVAAISCTATDEGDHYVLNGEKTWISNGGIADFYCVFARTGEAPGARGLSAFIIDRDSPGFTIPERIAVMAPHPLATLRFEDCKIAKTALIGAPGQGFKIAMTVLDVFRSTVGAAALGLARRALDEALGRAGSRHLFGAPLFDLQLTQASLAEMALGCDASALLVYRSAWTKDQGAARVTREAAMAKLFATENAQRTIDRAVQIFGAQGVVSGHIVERLYREIRALRIYEGASEVQKVVIARTLVGGLP